MRIEDATQTKDGTPWEFFNHCGDYVYGVLHYRERLILGKWKLDGKPVGTFFFPPSTIHHIRGDYSGPEGLQLDLHDWRDEVPWEHLWDEIQEVRKACGRWWGCSAIGSPICEISGVKMPVNAPELGEAKRPKE